MAGQQTGLLAHQQLQQAAPGKVSLANMKIRNKEMIHSLKKSNIPDGFLTQIAREEIQCSNHRAKESQCVRDCTYMIHCIE